MSSSPCPNVHHTTKAVIQWQSDETTRTLTKPDPKVSSITLVTRFDKTCAFFELSIPLKLKGIDTTTAITLRACASSIASLDLVKNPTVPTAIQKEFGSTTLCLGLTLKRHLDVFVPTPASEPLSPARAHSGAVLDAVRDFCQVTAFSLYIEARAAPSGPGFQSISDAVSQGLLESFNSSRYQLASMYGGLGGKLVILFIEATLPPPSYDDSDPPPPPPIDSYNDRKRPRQDSSAERHDEITLIWNELRAMKEAKIRDEKRIEALEKENTELKQSMDTFRTRCDALEKSQQDLKHSFEVLETANEKFTDTAAEALMDTFDSELTELRDDMRAMEEAVEFIQEGQVSDDSVKRVKDAVVQHFATRLFAE
ncbi:hypothetical protein FHETE_8707 [Fusarium heterosporum]|uniref:Uncharacterized protein n=1 Tax=Fusarium heterosporum TaxID=42747 RepID=A0A8H5WI48_FUSHE|nr:hypothetical protein FHETE_8707 [Fusarium heterosporum]